MNRKIKAFALIVSLLFSGCSQSARHTDPVKIKDYLYEINYSKYTITQAHKSLAKLPEGDLDGFGCSSVRNGNYYGRSFDFTYNEMCEFIVKSTAGKYKNIGIAIANVNTTEENIEAGLSNHQYDVLPFSVVDGINEKGVVCNANVVPVMDLVSAGKSRTTGTNPGKRDYFYQFLCRYILDNAGSAIEAVNMIQNDINVTNTVIGRVADYYTLNKHGYELHYMVADADNTFIIEFVDNHINIVEDTVMTNYYLSINETSHACGIERYQTLKDHYSEGTSVEGMASLMQRVQYTQIAKVDNHTPAVKWYSDLVSGDLTRNDVIDLIDNHFDEAEKLFNASYSFIQNNDRSGHTTDVVLNIGGVEVPMSVGAPWQSTHMSVYDIANKTLRLVNQENYDNPLYYSLLED